MLFVIIIYCYYLISTVKKITLNFYSKKLTYTFYNKPWIMPSLDLLSFLFKFSPLLNNSSGSIFIESTSTIFTVWLLKLEFPVSVFVNTWKDIKLLKKHFWTNQFCSQKICQSIEAVQNYCMELHFLLIDLH